MHVMLESLHTTVLSITRAYLPPRLFYVPVLSTDKDPCMPTQWAYAEPPI